ncbi:hypothetical protein CBOM_08120 [Ceraceosorus bombacis]|uniref:Uncharacterized protein n=1 Tax=Ceraceosorus bombacis TaxID=401625 RepID=A0A0P1B794_9BASI|nr:hypothetical protein CBOM_08120 [Ceraceosorus bombacis]
MGREGIMPLESCAFAIYAPFMASCCHREIGTQELRMLGAAKQVLLNHGRVVRDRIDCDFEAGIDV